MTVPWDFKFDPVTDDLELDATGQLAITTSLADVVAERICARLRTFQGEVFVNRDRGVPYFQEVNEKNPDVDRVRNLLLAETASVKDVLKVLSFDSTFDVASRTFSVRFKVQVDGAIAEGEI